MAGVGVKSSTTHYFIFLNKVRACRNSSIREEGTKLLCFCYDGNGHTCIYFYSSNSFQPFLF
jgi:hypothetical protein